MQQGSDLYYPSLRIGDGIRCKACIFYLSVVLRCHQLAGGAVLWNT